MTEKPTIRPLLTYQEKIVYLDPASGELRHGPRADSPRNVGFMRNGDAARLVHTAAGGLPREITLSPGPQPAPARLQNPGIGAMPWQVVAAEENAFGLRHAGHFLCADLAGHVTLSRQHLSLWEKFSVPETPVPAAAGAAALRQRAETLYRQAQTGQRVDANGILLELSPDSDVLLISCSGIVPRKIVYAMENSARSFATSKMFICDRRNLWYYSGIEGLTKGFSGTIDLVRLLISQIKPRLTCAVGTSAGGYMALALAARLGLDRALAFSPQTILTPDWLTAHQDTRWEYNMSIIQSRLAPRTPFDIAELIKARTINTAGKRTEFFIVYPGDDVFDAQHATRLEGFSQVHTYRIDGGDHNVSAELNRRGKLAPLLDTFISHPGPGLPSQFLQIIGQS
jgi:predicted esterase YcpF (UPF0227 family)